VLFTKAVEDYQIALGRIAATTDSDATAFISAAGITDPTQIAAISQLVVDLKDNGIWTQMKAIYPFVGGTATSHKYNLKDPRDLDAAFRITFAGTVTHNANGMTPNGSTGYGDTHYNDSTSGTANSLHVSMYSKTQPSLAGTVFDLGATPDATHFIELQCNTAGNTKLVIQDSTFLTANPAGSGAGMFIITRTASNVRKVVIRGTETSDAQASNGLVNANLYLGARNFGGSADGFSSRTFAFASVGSGLTSATMQNLHAIVESFQIMLGRQQS
jgi:hypothetical protein